jgi:hypothetical protein
LNVGRTGWFPVWKRNEGYFRIIYNYFPPRVSSKISLWRLYYIFQNLVGLKERKFCGNILNRSTTNVYDSGNFEQSGFNVNMDENGVSNVSASSSKWEDIFVSYESENLKDLSAYRLVSMAIINSILESGVCSECKSGQLNMREDVQCFEISSILHIIWTE